MLISKERVGKIKTWKVNYGGNNIVVENRMSGEYLYVNNEVQDEQHGLTMRSRLWGQLQTGEKIKISLGGFWTINCRIFIDNKLVSHEKK